MAFAEPTDDDRSFMRVALEEAQRAYDEGGMPVGVRARRARSIGGARTQSARPGRRSDHGEMDCLRRAGRRPHYRNTMLYTTLSPCMMCTGTILQFGISRVVVGERYKLEGHCEFLAERGVEVVLLDDSDCIDLMARCIRERPEPWNEDIAEES